MLQLLVLLVLGQLQTPPPIPIVLSSITLAEAEVLDGRLVVAGLDLLGNWDTDSGLDFYGNHGPDDSIERTVIVAAGVKLEAKGVVVGVLKVVRHPATIGADGTRFDSFTELIVKSSDRPALPRP